MESAPFGLSQDLSITRKEAAEYIEKYFETYPKIKSFLDGLVAEGKEKGYVTTMVRTETSDTGTEVRAILCSVLSVNV